ncbi:MAG: alpha-mannosidase, partial [Armatimonadetes bacterium]|nr:alpha-mannosidase [Armatimonadota bacterium]
PVSSGLKDLTVHLIGHAHIDMNWLWLWPETVDVCKNTFSTMTKLLNEYPAVRFSQSQAATYVAVEEADPLVFARVRERIKKGQWEVTGGAWVEGDMNMASGESIVRQILYAKQYFREKFGVEPVVGWEPDTFGHAWTIPQILAKSGIKYYYFMRGGKGEPIFWWEGPDGSRVLAYNRGKYNGSISDDVGDAVLDVNKRYGAKDGLFVYGVGDHGGGPTRRDINKAIALRKRDVYPTVKFDTAAGFFDSLLAQKTGSSFPPRQK